MSSDIPTFQEFVRPVHLPDTLSDHETTPLSRLAAGDYAVLAWLDQIGDGLPADVEADLVASWDRLTLRDVYLLVHPTAEGAQA
jgi:hypothetical protein